MSAWNSLGGVRASIGLPIADAAAIGNKQDRFFSDFEEGVIIASHKTSHAAVAKPASFFAGRKFPVTAAEILKQVKASFPQMISNFSLPKLVKKTNIKADPVFRVGVANLNNDPRELKLTTTYGEGGNPATNRRHKFVAALELVTGALTPNIDVTITMDVLVHFDPTKGKHGQILTSLHSCFFNVHVPVLGTQAQADTVGHELDRILKPLIGTALAAIDMTANDAALHTLSAKTMSNGDVNVFVSV